MCARRHTLRRAGSSLPAHSDTLSTARALLRWKGHAFVGSSCMNTSSTAQSRRMFLQPCTCTILCVRGG